MSTTLPVNIHFIRQQLVESGHTKREPDRRESKSTVRAGNDSLLTGYRSRVGQGIEQGMSNF